MQLAAGPRRPRPGALEPTTVFSGQRRKDNLTKIEEFVAQDVEAKPEVLIIMGSRRLDSLEVAAVLRQLKALGGMCTVYIGQELPRAEQFDYFLKGGTDEWSEWFLDLLDSQQPGILCAMDASLA